MRCKGRAIIIKKEQRLPLLMPSKSKMRPTTTPTMRWKIKAKNCRPKPMIIKTIKRRVVRKLPRVKKEGRPIHRQMPMIATKVTKTLVDRQPPLLEDAVKAKLRWATDLATTPYTKFSKEAGESPGTQFGRSMSPPWPMRPRAPKPLKNKRGKNKMNRFEIKYKLPTSNKNRLKLHNSQKTWGNCKRSNSNRRVRSLKARGQHRAQDRLKEMMQIKNWRCNKV